MAIISFCICTSRETSPHWSEPRTEFRAVGRSAGDLYLEGGLGWQEKGNNAVSFVFLSFQRCARTIDQPDRPEFIPLANVVAARFVQLPGEHPDLQERFVSATVAIPSCE